VIAGAALWAAHARAGAAGITVEAGGENKFSPKVAEYIVISTNFYFEWGDSGAGTERKHQIVQDKGLFRSPGGPRKSVPKGYILISASAGTFPYHDPEYGGPGGEGMSGVIKAVPTFGPAKAPPGLFSVKWAVERSTTGDQYDVRYRVENRDWKTWKRNTSARDAIFGQNDNPVNVQDGKTYKIQARSEKSAKPSHRSKWSPSFAVALDP